jgi:adenylate kinase family enzyme
MKEYKRILIFGSPGSGKNWFGERFSGKTGIKFYDTDDMAWKKRFTIRRSWDEKFAMLKKTSAKDKWIIGTGATSYIEPAVKRAELIIMLKVGFFRSTYRILRRQILHSREGREESQYSILSLACQNLLRHLKKDKQEVYFEELRVKYPNKCIKLSQNEKQKILEGDLNMSRCNK